MDDATYARIEAKRAQQAYFRDLTAKAKRAKYRPPAEPKAPRVRRPRPSRATGAVRGGRERKFFACSGCGRPFRTRSQRRGDHPGTVLNAGGGRCKSCRQDSPRKGMIGRPAKRSRVCVSCGRGMRMSSRENLATHPGTVPYGRDDKCRTCVKHGA